MSRDVYLCFWIFTLNFWEKGIPNFFRAWMKMVHPYAFLGRWFFARFWWIQRELDGPKVTSFRLKELHGFWGSNFTLVKPIYFWPFFRVFTLHLSRSFFVPTCTHCYIPWRIQSRLVWCKRKCWFLLGQWVGTCIIHGSYGYLDGAN